MSLKQRIDDGLSGKYEGLANGFNRINKYLFGIQRKCYYLLGGASGTYKSTLINFMLTNAILDAESKGIKLDIHYYSYEIDKLTMQCNWLSRFIYQKYNIVIPPEVIKGFGKNRLTKDEQTIVDNEIPHLEAIFNKINFKFIPNNPTGIYHDMWEFAEANGQIIYESIPNSDKKRIVEYKPNDPNAYTLIILDHLYHLKKERGFETKEVIDKHSEYSVLLRNLFGYTIFNLQQFNDGLSSVERMKFKGVDLAPQMTDFKDTRNPYADADVVLGTMCPYKMDMKSCLGYDIDRFQDRMIMLKIIKNRLSDDNKAIGLYVNPKSGSFEELPIPEEFKLNPYLYDRYK